MREEDEFYSDVSSVRLLVQSWTEMQFWWLEMESHSVTCGGHLEKKESWSSEQEWVICCEGLSRRNWGQGLNLEESPWGGGAGREEEEVQREGQKCREKAGVLWCGGC